ncbi:MAG: ABC transporter substrate-binding protein [Pseudomonadota bacterium]|nr:ABC transporter substrate-binding protein [Pseudomonadota bacterium]
MIKKILNAFAALSLLLVTGSALADARPAVVNFGIATAGVGGRPQAGGFPVATAHARGVLESALAEEGVQIKWHFFPTAGPGVNEALSNNLLDIVFQGDLPNIIGKAAGLDTRLIVAGSRNGHSYVVARAGSPINSIADLKGKKVAIFKGTCTHLVANRLLAANNLAESDLVVYNMDGASSNAAIASGDIDAVFTGGAAAFSLRDRGLGRIIYSGKGDDGKFGCSTGILATRKFAERYPDITQKIVTTLVRNRVWAGDPANEIEQYGLWAKSGYAFRYWREDFGGTDLKRAFSPLLDQELRTNYKEAVQDSLDFGLIRRPVDIDEWFDDQYLNRALSDLGLEDYWQ